MSLHLLSSQHLACGHALLDWLWQSSLNYTEEYPNEHKFSCYISDDNDCCSPLYLDRIIESMESYGSASIDALLQVVLSDFSKMCEMHDQDSLSDNSSDAGSVEDQDEDQYEDFEDFNADLDLALPANNPTIDWPVLQQ